VRMLSKISQLFTILSNDSGFGASFTDSDMRVRPQGFISASRTVSISLVLSHDFRCLPNFYDVKSSERHILLYLSQFFEISKNRPKI
jgi:hypothetical protein